MRCKRCNACEALVHLFGISLVGSERLELNMHDICETCADTLEIESRGIPPRISTPEDVEERIRVIQVTDKMITLRILPSGEFGVGANECQVHKSLIPEYLLKPGKEFIVIGTPKELHFFNYNSWE
jgi:hypothetical protein